SNAFKYTLAGRVAVRLRKADRAAVLEVSDTGVGIAAHELPRLFERFHRIEGVQGRTLEGTGIGLALVRELVRLHGGNVDVDSAVQRGSVFRVSLPLGRDHLPAEHVGAARGGSARSQAAAYVEEALRWIPNSADEAHAERTMSWRTLTPPDHIAESERQ